MGVYKIRFSSTLESTLYCHSTRRCIIDKRKEELSGYSKSEQSAAKILLARMQKLAKEHKCVRCGGDHKVSACKENKPKLERCAFLLGRVFTGVLVNAPGFVCAPCP